MHPTTFLSDSLLSTKSLLARYLAGFDDSNHTRQAPHLPNHVAWTLGHLAITMGRAGEKLSATPGLPQGMFIENTDRGEPGPRGRFATESVSFNSTPTADPTRYPSLARCVEIYDASCDHLAALIQRVDPSRLEMMYPWGPIQISGAMMISRMVFHNGTHTGQLADLRRALAMPRVLG